MIRVYVDVSNHNKFYNNFYYNIKHMTEIFSQISSNFVEDFQFYVFSNTVKYIYSVKKDDIFTYEMFYNKIPCSLMNKSINIEKLSYDFKNYSKPSMKNCWGMLPSTNKDKNIFIAYTLVHIALPTYNYVHPIKESKLNIQKMKEALYG